MKKTKYFFGAIAALMMASCSSNDEPKPETPDVNGTDNYVTVNILASGAENGRAASDFTDGDDAESKVINALFMFFDDTDKLVDYSTPAIEWKENSSNPENPAVTKVGSVEINLKEGLIYKKVVVALNPSAEGIAQLYGDVRTMADLNKFYKDYASLANAKNNAQRFVMSTSSYYADAARNQLVNATPITNENIYKASEKVDGNPPATAKTVDMYVERTVAKIELTNSVNTDNFELNANDENDKTKLILTGTDGRPKTPIVIKPVLLAMAVNVDCKNAYLVKKIDNLDNFGYGNGEGGWKNFEWNDPENHRSYWANTIIEGATKKQQNYLTWAQLTADKYKIQDNRPVVQYINPNTYDYAIRDDAGTQSTKVMIMARLCEDGDPDKPLDLIKCGDVYYTKDDFLTLAADKVNAAIKNIKDSPRFTAADMKLKQSGDVNPQTGAHDMAYAVKVMLKQDVTDKTVASAIESCLKSNFNDFAPRFWNKGKTYYFTSIRHQGFTGLSGTGEEYLYGVVRNHHYKINISSISGLGTPVSTDPDDPDNPDEPIDPDRPKGDPTYMKANIKILKWRIVSQSLKLE